MASILAVESPGLGTLRCCTYIYFLLGRPDPRPRMGNGDAWRFFQFLIRAIYIILCVCFFFLLYFFFISLLLLLLHFMVRMHYGGQSREILMWSSRALGASIRFDRNQKAYVYCLPVRLAITKNGIETVIVPMPALQYVMVM